MTNLKLRKQKWQHLGSREVAILFATLVIQSYKTTFPNVGLKGIEKALGNGVINCGEGLLFKSYRSVAELKKSTHYFIEIFGRNPHKLDDLYRIVQTATKDVVKNIQTLTRIIKKARLNEDDFGNFYHVLRDSFLKFFPLQVFPFSLEQVLIAAGEQKLLNKHKKLLVKWRSSVHNVEIELEDLLSLFFQKSKKELGIDLRYWSDLEVVAYFKTSKKPQITKLKNRIKFSVVAWDTSTEPPYTIYSGTRAKTTGKVLEDETKEKITGTSFQGEPIYPGHVKGKAFVIHKKADFKKIPSNAVVVAKVVEVDDIRWLKIKKIGAVVTEEGGLTTHIAITGRELKIPTIVGVKGLTRIVKTDNLIDVDSGRGKVEIIK